MYHVISTQGWKIVWGKMSSSSNLREGTVWIDKFFEMLKQRSKAKEIKYRVCLFCLFCFQFVLSGLVRISSY